MIVWHGVARTEHRNWSTNVHNEALAEAEQHVQLVLNSMQCASAAAIGACMGVQRRVMDLRRASHSTPAVALPEPCSKHLYASCVNREMRMNLRLGHLLFRIETLAGISD